MVDSGMTWGRAGSKNEETSTRRVVLCWDQLPLLEFFGTDIAWGFLKDQMWASWGNWADAVLSPAQDVHIGESGYFNTVPLCTGLPVNQEMIKGMIPIVPKGKKKKKKPWMASDQGFIVTGMQQRTLEDSRNNLYLYPYSKARKQEACLLTYLIKKGFVPFYFLPPHCLVGVKKLVR